MRSFLISWKKRSKLVVATIFVIVGAIGLALVFQEELAEAGKLVISEVRIGGGPGKTAEDFVKICNISSETQNLKGVRLVKRTKTGTSDTSLKSWTDDNELVTGICKIWANSSYAEQVQADWNTSGTLAEDNCLALRNGAEDTGELLDALAWGECSSLKEGTGIANPAEGAVMKRFNNQDTDNNATDFADNPTVVTETGSGSSGSGGGSGGSTVAVSNGHLYLNELLPDPKSGEPEWIELYYSGTTALDLSGYLIEDASGTKHKLEGSVLNYLTIDNLKISLNNNGDTVYLKNSNGQLIDSITYGEKAGLEIPENQSLAREVDGTGSWKITAKTTKNSANTIEQQNVTTVSAKETPTKKGIMITEILADSPGPEIINNREFIELYNSSDEKIDLQGYTLTVNNEQEFTFSDSELIEAGAYLAIPRAKSKLALPNSGGDLRLFEPTKKTATQIVKYKSEQAGTTWAYDDNNKSKLLADWRMTMSPTPGAKNIFTAQNKAPILSFDCPDNLKVNETFWIEAGDSFDPEGAELKFTLDFGNGFVSHYGSQDYAYGQTDNYVIKVEVSDGYLTTNKNCKVKVTAVKADETKAVPVKKAAVVKKTATKKASTASVKKSSSTKKTSTKKTSTKSSSTTSTNKTIKIDSSKIAIMEGQVLSLPGDFGSQFFYLATTKGTWQIYNYNKLFPKLTVGQQIKASGELSENTSEPRLKTKVASDIKIIGAAEALTSETKKVSDIGPDSLLNYVKISGQVLGKRGDLFYLEDGTGEILVALPKELGDLKIVNGDEAEIEGIVRQTTAGLRLAVRTAQDIKLIKKIDTVNKDKTTTTEIVSDKPISSTLPTKDKEEKVIRYMLAIIGLLCLTIGGILYKKSKKIVK